MKVYSIFMSADGEVCKRGMGTMTVFVRFAGCSANCKYCDTTYAKSKDSGTEMSVMDVMKHVSCFNCNNVTITGGEPFEQPIDVLELLEELVANGYKVSVETNGFHPFIKMGYPLDQVNWIVDLKTEGSTYMDRFVRMNLDGDDFIKMVVGTKEEFLDAVSRKIYLQNKGVKARFAFSPVANVLEPATLLEWMILEGQTDANLNVQLHKVLGFKEPK